MTFLKYIDEDDRAYGVAGMTIALVLWDGEPYLSAINIDNPVGSSVVFTPSFGFSGNPRMLASLAWREILRQFELTAAMIMGNAICRSYLGEGMSLNSDVNQNLRAIIHKEGMEICSLESDEIDIIYNKTLRYLDRVFTHAGVSGLARDLASALKQRRHLSASEVFEILSALNHM